MTDKPSEAYLATLTDNTREYIRSLEATLTAHEATIAELRATNIEQAKAIGDQVATIADRNELIAHLQERLDA